MKQKSLTINAALNGFKSSLSVLFPLITYPYAFRILHASGIGRVDYSSSIVEYFVLLAMLGTSNYAIREGAKLRDDRKELSKLVNEIFSITVVSTTIAYCLLFICLFTVKKLEPYRALIILLSGSIGFTVLGIDWINNIFEDFLRVTVRSIVTHLLTLTLLFLLVKDSNDVMVYAALFVLNNLIICITNLLYSRRHLKLRFTPRMNLKKHLRPILTLFANAVTISIYVNSDMVMLGWIAGDAIVGYYACAVKIYNVVKTTMAAIYSVIIPRIAYHIGKNEVDKVREIYTNAVCCVSVLLFPAATGLAVVAGEVILLMGGTEYIAAIPTLRLLCISLVGAVLGGMITFCLNVPLGREKINMEGTLLSAGMNLLLNFLLIPIFAQNGAAFATAISEFLVLIYCLLKGKNIRLYLDLKQWKASLIPALLGCVSICAIGCFVHRMIEESLFSLLAIVGLSILLYGLELIVTGEPITKQGIQMIKEKRGKVNG